MIFCEELRAGLSALMILSIFAGCSAVNPISSEPMMQIVDVSKSSGVALDPVTQKRSKAMHAFLVGQMAVHKDDYKGALKSFKEVDKLITSPSMVVKMKLARLQLQEGDLDKAKIEAEKALKNGPNDLEALKLYGGILEAKKYNDEALKVYQRVLEIDPDNEEGQFLLIHLKHEMGHFDDSIQLLQRRIKKEPERALLHFWLARAYEGKNELDEAIVSALNAVRLDKANDGFQIDLIRMLLKRGLVDRAKGFAVKLLERNPKNSDARRVLGHLYVSENNLSEALEQFKALAGLEDDPSDTRFKLALIYLDKREPFEAEKELKLLLARSPGHHQGRYYLATIQASTQRFDEAINNLKLIPVEHELYNKAQLFLAVLWRDLGQKSKSEKILKKLINDDPNNLEALSTYITSLREKGDYKRAEDVLSAVSRNHPRDERLLTLLAAVQHELGKKIEAQQVMRKVLSFNPEAGDALNYIAYGLAESGSDLKEAQSLAERAVSGSPNQGYYLDTLGWIYYKQGNYKKAVEYLKRANEEIKNDAVVLEHLGDALLANQEKLEALAVYNRAIELLKKDGEHDETAVRLSDKIKDGDQ